MIRKALSVLALASVSAVAAHAQGTMAAAAPAAAVKPITFGVKAGGSIPLSDFSDAAKTGYLLGAQIGLATPALPVTFRVDADFSQYDSKVGTGKGQIWGFTGNALYDLPLSASPIKPYAIAGAGLYTSKASGSPHSNDFGFNVGGGVKIPLSGFNTFIEARYTRINTTGTATQFVPIYVGVSLL